MTQVKRRKPTTRKPAATIDRNFRTFLLMSQLEKRAIGARIKQSRKEAGMTQEEMADLAEGFSTRSLQDYENGVTIPFKHLREISGILNKSIPWILHGEDAESPAGETLSSERAEELLVELREVAPLVRDLLRLLPRQDGPQAAAESH